MQPDLTTRRDFLHDVAGLAVTLSAATTVRAREADSVLVIALGDKRFQQLAKPGQSVFVASAAEKHPLLVWRQSKDSVRVFSATCTHKGCKVKLPKKNLIVCPCHGANFDIDGNSVKGPAKDKLKEYDADLKDDAIVIHLHGRSGPETRR